MLSPLHRGGGPQLCAFSPAAIASVLRLLGGMLNVRMTLQLVFIHIPTVGMRISVLWLTRIDRD
jgi:hypothetical protein